MKTLYNTLYLNNEIKDSYYGIDISFGLDTKTNSSLVISLENWNNSMLIDGDIEGRHNLINNIVDRLVKEYLNLSINIEIIDFSGLNVCKEYEPKVSKYFSHKETNMCSQYLINTEHGMKYKRLKIINSDYTNIEDYNSNNNVNEGRLPREVLILFGLQKGLKIDAQIAISNLSRAGRCTGNHLIVFGDSDCVDSQLLNTFPTKGTMYSKDELKLNIFYKGIDTIVKVPLIN